MGKMKWVRLSWVSFIDGFEVREPLGLSWVSYGRWILILSTDMRRFVPLSVSFEMNQ
jgi:hypothetical protein